MDFYDDTQDLCFKKHGMEGTDAEKKAFYLAYDLGHAYSWDLVMAYFDDLVEIIKLVREENNVINCK